MTRDWARGDGGGGGGGGGGRNIWLGWLWKKVHSFFYKILFIKTWYWKWEHPKNMLRLRKGQELLFWILVKIKYTDIYKVFWMQRTTRRKINCRLLSRCWISCFRDLCMWQTSLLVCINKIWMQGYYINIIIKPAKKLCCCNSPAFRFWYIYIYIYPWCLKSFFFCLLLYFFLTLPIRVTYLHVSAVRMKNSKYTPDRLKSLKYLRTFTSLSSKIRRSYKKECIIHS